MEPPDLSDASGSDATGKFGQCPTISTLIGGRITRAEPHCQSVQAHDVEQHYRTWKTGCIDGLSSNRVFPGAIIVRPNRQRVSGLLRANRCKDRLQYLFRSPLAVPAAVSTGRDGNYHMAARDHIYLVTAVARRE